MDAAPGGRDCLPNLVIIGAQKCGTTSLHRYLDLHPEISMSAVKEPNYFLWHYDRGPEWWRSQFRRCAPVRGEASTDYTAYPMATGVPKRIFESVPDARLIYLVRDPVERLVSQYVHNRATGIEPRPPDVVFRHPALGQSDFVYRGLYGLQLEQYLEYFASDQVLILEQDQLLERREPTLREVFAFLGVDDSFASPSFADVHHVSADKRRVRTRRPSRRLGELIERLERLPAPVPAVARHALLRPVERPALDDALREHLASFFHDDARRFRMLTGRDFGHWSV